MRRDVALLVLATHAASFMIAPTVPRPPKRVLPHTKMATGGQGIKEQADSVPLPLAAGMEQALSDLLGKLLDVLEEQERISGKKFSRADVGTPDQVVTLKGNGACWSPKTGCDSSLSGEASLKPWGAPLAALFQDDFGAVKTMALFSAIKLADGAYGQFRDIVAGTWEGMPPNIKVKASSRRAL